ncbi:hypothetical protein Tco_0708425 [Tanacetum coccineum]
MSILLLAIPDEYLLKFHNVPDAKSVWESIKSRFGGNEESKKMQKNVLKHQFENFTTAPNESLDKDYDRFQKLISQLEVYAAPVLKEDINQKVYEDEMKRSSSSTSNSQNLAFLSYENTSSTNEVSTASGNFGVNTAGGTSSTSQGSSTLGADEVVCSFFAQQKTSPPLDNEDLQQIYRDELEELDIRWQVAMITVRVQRFIQKTGRNLDFKGIQPVTDRYGYIKNHKKTVKNGQTRTRETEEHKRSQGFRSKAKKSQLSVNLRSGPDWMFDLDFLTNTMNYIPVSVENQVNVDAGTQEHYVAGSSEKDKEPTQEYILLPLHPHRPRISVEDVVQAAQEKPSKNSPKDNDVQDSEDVAEKEEQHTLTEAEQALKDDLERMIAQEICWLIAIDDDT